MGPLSDENNRVRPLANTKRRVASEWYADAVLSHAPILWRDGGSRGPLAEAGLNIPAASSLLQSQSRGKRKADFSFQRPTTSYGKRRAAVFDGCVGTTGVG
mmetsp:Transcript_11272/g.20530  ORF Transcript_11272/g.20530 Transcript_11272/m.20530 type:complete len:101 (-) Transcript_11272:478-780(-)